MLTEFQKLKALAGSSWGFWIALFLSSAEAGYTYIVFSSTSKLPAPFSTAQAIVIAFFMDMAVLYFTVTGHKRLSVFYWIAMTGYVVLADFISVPEAHIVILVWKAITLPAAIYFFSHTMTMATTIKAKDGSKKTVTMKATSSSPEDEKEEKKQLIMTLKKQGLSTREIAPQVDLHFTTVNKIVKGQIWN
jgi:hypothetical protein